MAGESHNRKKFLNHGKGEEREKIKVMRWEFVIIRAQWFVKRYIQENDAKVNTFGHVTACLQHLPT